MASVRVNMRIPADVWAAVSSYAKHRESNNTEVVVTALKSFFEDTQGGVPDVPMTKVENLAETADGRVVRKDPEKPASFEVPKPEPDAPVDRWHDWAMERQARLNADKERKR
jgi:hypothetical protein